MNARDLGSWWLREKAEELRGAAVRHERAGYGGELAHQCWRVASAYRRAALLLDGEADAIEAEA